MSVKLECDRCGAQEQTSGVMLLAGHCGPGIPSLRPELPAGWTRPKLPNEDGSADDRELCSACKADLLRFMAGQPVIDLPLPEKPGSRTNARGNCFGVEPQVDFTAPPRMPEAELEALRLRPHP